MGLPLLYLSHGITGSFPGTNRQTRYQNANIVLIHVFKEYCALLFFKGVLLNDAQGILVQQTKNVQAARQVRFTNVGEINKLKPILKSYIFEAIEVEQSGLKVSFKKTSAFTVPEEFQSKLNKKPALKKAFDALTPGRQRAYLLYFSAPKQSKTRESRVEKYVPQILNGKGLDDERKTPQSKKIMLKPDHHEETIKSC